MTTVRLCGAFVLLTAVGCADGGDAPDSTAAPPASASPASTTTPLGQPAGTSDIPAQPIQWGQREFEVFLASRAKIEVQPAPAPTAAATAVRRSAVLRGVPVARYGVEGTLVEAYMLGDPITSLQASREVARVSPVPPVVFTSNNMLVVAYDTTPAVLRLRRVLTADTSRSGFQKEPRP